jgi:hypothetical protein
MGFIDLDIFRTLKIVFEGESEDFPRVEHAFVKRDGIAECIAGKIEQQYYFYVFDHG